MEFEEEVLDALSRLVEGRGEVLRLVPGIIFRRDDGDQTPCPAEICYFISGKALVGEDGFGCNLRCEA